MPGGYGGKAYREAVPKKKKPKNTTGYVPGVKGGKKGTVHETGKPAPRTDALHPKNPSQNKPGKQTTKPPRRSKKVRRKARERRSIKGRILEDLGKREGPDFGEVARDVGEFVAPDIDVIKEQASKALKGRSTEVRAEDYSPEEALTAAELIGAGKLASTAAKGVKATTTAAKAEKALKRAAKGAKAAPKKKVAKVKSAPKRAKKRIKETPQRVKTAPRRAKKAASTKEGRKAARKTATKKVYSHPFASAGAGAYTANKAGVDAPGVDQVGALVEGHVEALKDNPVKTLKTTARAIPGIVTGPAALLGSAGSSIAHGTTKPLEEEASKQFKGLKEVGGKLLSGDPETVQKSVEDEVGLSFVVPIPAATRLRGTKGYRKVRGKARAKVATKRERTRAKRREELRAHKTGDQLKKPKKIRHAVRDTATGEERILRRTGKVLEGHRQRKAVSTDVSRNKAQGEREALLASKEVVKQLRKSRYAGGRKSRADAGDALATVAQYGISRDPEKAMRQLDAIEKSTGKLDPDQIPTNSFTDLTAIRFLRDNPGIFKDKAFWKAVDAYKRQAREIETSGRKKVLAIGDTYGLKRPEEMLEEGVTVGGRTIKSRYMDPDIVRRKQAELSGLRRDAKLNRELAAKATGKDRETATAIATEIAARGKALERELRDQRIGRKQAEKDYSRAAQGVIRREGLEQPAYVKDVKPRQGLAAGPGFPGGRSARKQHMAKGIARERGIAERNFETLVNQSIAEPRMRRAMHRATTAFSERWAQTVNGKRVLTSREIERAINRGELDEGQYAVLHSQFFKQAILDPHKSGDEFLTDIRAALDTPISAELKRRAADPGHKYVVVPKEAVREFVHQMEPPKGLDRVFGSANRFFSRVILGYSPAWAVAQVIAEGLPASIAIGANPARWARVAKFLAREDKKLSTKDRAAIDGMVGESAGVTPHPQVQFRPDTNLMGSRFFRLSNRNHVGRAIVNGATGSLLGQINRFTGGKTRKAVAAAKADREFNSFAKSLSGLLKGQRSIIEAIKGKPIDQQLAYMAKHPAQAAKLEGYLDNVMGNWRALTRHEAKIAPLVVFYPFVRYSLRWMFWAFPKEHPVKASILYFLSQQNAEEVEKLIGGPPANPLDYTVPIYSTDKKEDAALPGGSRIAPGMNALTTAIGKGRVETTLSGLNPLIGAVVTGATGIDPFTGEKRAENLGEHGLLFLNQLLSMPAPARLLDLNDVGQGEQSDVSKAFEGMDPNRDLRSAVFPFTPQSGARFRDQAKLGVALRDSGYDPELGDEDIDKALRMVGEGDTSYARKLAAKRKRGDKAADEIGRLVAEYVKDPEGLPKLSDKQYEWLGKITGKRVFPYTPPKPRPFGLPEMDSESLREQFGLSATSTSDLRKQFGLEP